MTVWMCGSSSFHPYECSHDSHCIHCTNGETEWHKPEQCALCDPFDRGRPKRLVDGPYEHPIPVRDFSHRKRRVPVRVGHPSNVQQELAI